MSLRQHSQSRSDQIAEILSRASKDDDEFQKQREGGMGGLNLPMTERTRVPGEAESIDTIPQELADLTPGDPKNTEILDQQFKRLASEIDALSQQKDKGVLEGLRGIRKWNVAIALALNPGMRGQINARLQKNREEGIAGRRRLMLSIGRELRARSINPIEQSRLEAVSRKVGAQQGDELVKQRKEALMDDAVQRGVIDDYDRAQLDRMGFGLKEKSRVPPDIQIKRNLAIINSSTGAVKGFSPKGVEAYSNLMREMGIPVNETWQDTLEASAASSQKKSAAGETPAAETARLSREAKQVWDSNQKLVIESSRSWVWVNEDAMKSVDPEAEFDDEGAVHRFISTWTPEEIKSATMRLSETSDLPRELFRRFWSPPEDEIGELGPAGDTWTEADEKALNEKLGIK